MQKIIYYPNGSNTGFQMEKEKRKRPAARPSKHVNKRGRAEKPAVTQGRRSKFTAMSAQTVNTSEDEDAATFQRQRCVQKCYQVKILGDCSAYACQGRL